MADSDVIDAMTQSGYPLQTIVGERLRTDFLFVQDEWGFVDRDTVKRARSTSPRTNRCGAPSDRGLDRRLTS